MAQWLTQAAGNRGHAVVDIVAFYSGTGDGNLALQLQPERFNSIRARIREAGVRAR